MGVAAGGHREVVRAGEPAGAAIRAASQEPRVVDLDGVGARQFRVRDVGGDAAARALKGVRNDRDSILFVDVLDGLGERQPRGNALVDAECEHVAGGAGHLGAGNPHQPVVGGALGGREAGVNLVVVGHRQCI